jgi:predicted ATP-grasp superfamily ATP-dependent carboligase
MGRTAAGISSGSRAGGMESASSRKGQSVILASGTAGGTIAAVRNLAASGIDVGVISSSYLCAAAWSRGATSSYLAPAESENRRFLERLLAIGEANPGQILLPTSDKTAWLYTANAQLLKQHFCLYQPSLTGMRCILDKMLFAKAAVRAGLAVLPSWDARSGDGLEALAPTLPYPILIKPRTHVHRLLTDKGIVVHSASKLIQQYRRIVGSEQHQADDYAPLPNAGFPILQQFVDVGSEGVHSVTGFIDRTGELFVTRQSRKVFLRSRPVGIGICFESQPASAALSRAVRHLCRELGYFGVFEVELVRFGEGWAAIDFNPRFYHQMGMDIRRGMPLPLLAYLDATGQTAQLRIAVARAQQDEVADVVFQDRFTLALKLFADSITARISGADRAYWRAWIKKNAARAVDVAADPSDPAPGIVHALSEIQLGLKAIPRFLRSPSPMAAVTTGLYTEAL